jgi:hypothetical protein
MEFEVIVGLPPAYRVRAFDTRGQFHLLPFHVDGCPVEEDHIDDTDPDEGEPRHISHVCRECYRDWIDSGWIVVLPPTLAAITDGV